MKMYINKFSVITFDIFDTLIERDVQTPSDIFYLSAKKVLGDKAAEIFRSRRIEAEKNARKKREDNEVTISEIYNELVPIYPNKYEELMNTEINMEILHCHKRKIYSDLMERFLNNGKKVYLISDMYLTSNIIAIILNHCGISGYHGLYISCEYRKNKITGELFRTVIEDSNILPRRILHFGDSLRADVFGAKKVGICSFWVYRKRNLHQIFH